MEAIIKFFCRLLYKLCYVIGKYVCKAIGAVCKFAWNTGRFLYRRHQEKKAAVASHSDGAAATAEAVVGPDKSVQIENKEKFANLTDDDLRLMLEKMTDNAVKVDAQPELEKLLETYGTDQEVFKQEIMEELKRREME